MLSKTKILYRADGGHPVGMGHIMRALRIVRELSNILDIDVLLVSRHNSTVNKVLDRKSPRCLHVHWIPAIHDSIVPVLQAEAFTDAAAAFAPDVIVVDALDTTDEDMRMLADIGSKLVTQDDRGPGRKYSDLIVNFLVRDPDANELDRKTMLLEGPEYAPLGPEYSTDQGGSKSEEPKVARTATVTMGGADAVGLAVKVAKCLIDVPELEEVRFCIGPAFQHTEELKSILSRASWRHNLLISIPTLRPLFLESDIAIVAGGITMHEAACCGTPSIAVCQPIDHQLLVAGWLEEAGAMINLGYGTDLEATKIASAVSSLISDQQMRQSMAEAGPKTVDGAGTRRVAEAIASLHLS